MTTMMTPHCFFFKRLCYTFAFVLLTFSVLLSFSVVACVGDAEINKGSTWDEGPPSSRWWSRRTDRCAWGRRQRGGTTAGARRKGTTRPEPNGCETREWGDEKRRKKVSRNDGEKGQEGEGGGTMHNAGTAGGKAKQRATV